VTLGANHTTKTNTHNTQIKIAQLAACASPIRLMAYPVRPVDRAGQAGGNKSCTEKIQEASVTPLGPRTKITFEKQTEGNKKNSSEPSKPT
jgi:hypothetical protein